MYLYPKNLAEREEVLKKLGQAQRSWKNNLIQFLREELFNTKDKAALVQILENIRAKLDDQESSSLFYDYLCQNPQPVVAEVIARELSRNAGKFSEQIVLDIVNKFELKVIEAFMNAYLEEHGLDPENDLNKIAGDVYWNKLLIDVFYQFALQDRESASLIRASLPGYSFYKYTHIGKATLDSENLPILLEFLNHAAEDSQIRKMFFVLFTLAEDEVKYSLPAYLSSHIAPDKLLMIKKMLLNSLLDGAGSNDLFYACLYILDQHKCFTQGDLGWLENLKGYPLAKISILAESISDSL